MAPKTLLLVGGGHAHIQVIKDLQRTSDVRLVLVSEDENAVYSGMLPAVVANLRPVRDALVNLKQLCAHHCWHFVRGRVQEIQPELQSVSVRTSVVGSPEDDTVINMKYDILSIDVGSTVRKVSGISWSKDDKSELLPMVLGTRPIGKLSPAIEKFQTAVRESGFTKTCRVVVLGDGAAGFELSCALNARLRKSLSDVCNVHVTICGNGQKLRSQFGPALARAANSALRARGITQLVTGPAARISSEEGIVYFGNGVDPIMFDLIVIATGAAAHSWLQSHSGLEVDQLGFVSVTPSLHTPRYPNVFAAGDCASFGSQFGPSFPPKAGVYAVRQGPILTHNLMLALSHLDSGDSGLPTFKRYKPQATFLTLLATGDGSALGSKYGVAFEGTWVYRLKSSIDEKWQAMFQVGDTYANESCESEMAIFDGSPAEGVAALLGARDVASTDAFEKQLAVLRRMDEDVTFRMEIVSIIASKNYVMKH